MKKIIISGTLLMAIQAGRLNAQTGPVATGSNASGSGGTISYSIGQIDYIIANGSGGNINQGLQQPYEILVMGAIEQTGINLTSSLYPNPTADFVVLGVGIAETQLMSYEINDLQGKLITHQKISGTQTTISMEELPNAVYFLKVLNNNKEVKTFKIIKNK